MKHHKNFSYYIIMVILFISAAVCLIPIINTIAISMSDRVSANTGKVTFWPVNFTLAPYRELLRDDQFFRSFGISVIRVIIGLFVNVILCIIMAYPLSKTPKQFRARSVYMWFVIFLLLFNGGLIPTYVLVSNLGMINSIWALVLPGAVPIFSVIVLMNFYKGLPSALEESALVDGAGPWRILLQIYVPLSLPSIAVISLWSVVGHWNDFLGGLIYMTDRTLWPLQTYIQSLGSNIDYQQMRNMNIDEILRMMELSSITFDSAKVIVAMIPVLLVYPFLQRYFVKGIVMGAVKE